MPSLKFENGEFLLNQNGKDAKYRRLIRNFAGSVTNLTAGKSSTKYVSIPFDLTEKTVFEHDSESEEKNEAPLPAFSKFINGTFNLGDNERFEKGNDKLGVIGNEHLTASTLSISFSSVSNEQLAELTEHKKQRVQKIYSWRNVGRKIWGSGDSSLGYVASDWEIGNGEEWFLSVYLPESIFNEVYEAIANNRTSKLFCAFEFPFFTNESFYVPSSTMTFYLPPAVEYRNKEEGDEETFNFSEPDYVDGYLKRLSFNDGVNVTGNSSNVVNETHNTYTAVEKESASENLVTRVKKAADSWVFWVALALLIYILRK